MTDSEGQAVTHLLFPPPSRDSRDVQREGLRMMFASMLGMQLGWLSFITPLSWETAITVGMGTPLLIFMVRAFSLMRGWD